MPKRRQRELLRNTATVPRHRLESERLTGTKHGVMNKVTALSGDLEKLTVPQLVEKFPESYGTRRFITVLTTVRHLPESPASLIQTMPPHTFYAPIYDRVLQVVSFPQVSPSKACMHLSPPPYVPHAQSISFFSITSQSEYNHSVPNLSTAVPYTLSCWDSKHFEP
jgi:hypothetical protein